MSYLVLFCSYVFFFVFVFLLFFFLFFFFCFLFFFFFVLFFFSPFSIAITSLGEERANVSALRTFVRFLLVWFCWFPLPLSVWKGLRFVIVTLPALYFYLLFYYFCHCMSLRICPGNVFFLF